MSNSPKNRTKLDVILEAKGLEVAYAMMNEPLAELKARSIGLPPRKGFHKTITSSKNSPALIAEVKKSSPSQGVIRPDFDPVQIAQTYESSGADCLSVLTDVEFFSGSPANLQLVRQSVNLPLLRKDFTIDPYQIYEALIWGADAILLIAAALGDSELKEFHDEAVSLGLDVLVEVHNEEELNRVSWAPLIGINNRNLSDFTTDIRTTCKLASLAPKEATLISESALDSKESVDFVTKCGARGVLIGTAFCLEEDIAEKVKSVMGW